MINLSICLSDLPKEKITTSGKNGKKYLSIIVDERKEKDQYGNTHTVYVSQTKEEREAKQPKTYVGNGKEYKFEQKPAEPVKAEIIGTPYVEENDLPF